NFHKGTKDSSKVKCFNCNKFRHVRRNCEQKDREQEQLNLVQEDVEPTLLMAVQGKGDKAPYSPQQNGIVERRNRESTTPPPYTYEPNSEGSTRHTSSTASSSRPFDHTLVQGYRNISKIYNRAPEVQSDELLLLEEEPRNYKEAVQDRKWIEAMQMEIDSINKNKTWKLTTLPDNQKAIDGKIIKHKARLVAKGYVQEHGINYDEVFSPVARMETVRLILALSAYHGWEVHHLD
nr:ribonuclease H-like domain, reverse transcriptase, RNA-dependent DNA polymerase [Tanacetum cinerariifolium]